MRASSGPSSCAPFGLATPRPRRPGGSGRARGHAVLLFCMTAALVSGCRQGREPEADPTAAALKSRLEGAVSGRNSGTNPDAKAWQQIRHFYALREDRPAWVAQARAKPAAKTMVAILLAAGDDGLDPKDYAVDSLQAGLQGLERGAAPEAAAELDLQLSGAALRYGADLALGHPSLAQQIDPDWAVAPRKGDPSEWLNQAIEANAVDRLPTRLAPPHPEYAHLKEALKRYRQIALEGKLQPVPALVLKPGQADAGLEILRRDLIVLGDLEDGPRTGAAQVPAAGAAPSAKAPEKGSEAAKNELLAVLNAYDPRLKDAVYRFQARHGLNPDGIPQDPTLGAINVTAQDRVRQIELNLERWRWMPADFGAAYVFVDVPGYRLQVRERDGVPLRMRAIVGRQEDRTPIFSGRMSEIVFSPYWNIPQSIELAEMLPAIRKDRAFLKKKDIEPVRIVDGRMVPLNPAGVHWNKVDEHTNLMLRQKPGDQNALGHVKFLFPNPHDVYLHDTPGGTLFDKLGRDLSHGCVRIEQPAELAAYVLRDQPEWTPERIGEAMHAGTEKHVPLKRPLPVYLVYLTANVGDDGAVEFFNDVYGYDQKQRELTEGGAAVNR